MLSERMCTDQHYANKPEKVNLFVILLSCDFSNSACTGYSEINVIKYIIIIVDS